MSATCGRTQEKSISPSPATSSVGKHSLYIASLHTDNRLHAASSLRPSISPSLALPPEALRNFYPTLQNKRRPDLQLHDSLLCFPPTRTISLHHAPLLKTSPQLLKRISSPTRMVCAFTTPPRTRGCWARLFAATPKPLLAIKARQSGADVPTSQPPALIPRPPPPPFLSTTMY